ncbi:hypothetical protein BaRGS_00000517 [Batillaria attramentaria]|uniref:Angiotensin-converting enzyme n=1 Tax=Batillaria attramentaria TaxID=370345 RepID=A0ABD0MAU8_9CAEN
MLLGILLSACLAYAGAQGTNTNQTAAQEFLDFYNTDAQRVLYASDEIAWTYYTNITEENQQRMVESYTQSDIWRQNMSRMASEFDTTNFPADMKRQFAKIKDIGTAALEDLSKLEQLNQVLSEMETIYSIGKVCFGPDDCRPLEPDLTRMFETSRDEKQLRTAWIGWRDATGKKMRELYTQFVSLSNEAVRTLGYQDTGDYWRSWYETDTFEQDVAALFQELKPFYEQLHAFVRRRLKAQYGESLFPSTGHIPAHLLGKPILDVTEEMVKQNYTAVKIFETADDFFKSLGMIEMPQEFWDKSMLTKPTDGREVVCHASAWDFYNGVDFRVKQCTDITMDDLSTAHHEMGHIEYYLQYVDQPIVYRRGANPGFHEAVGDVISLSVETPKHLNKIGLLPELVEDNEATLNFLMAMALQKIAFLPFGYLIDQWRWSVFKGDTTPDNYNADWWKLRCGLQGVSPPVARSEDDFDPGAKYHIPANTPYIRYFVSYVLQFQFHKALCEAAGHTGPLHTCDIYNSTEAGQKLSDMLKVGSSQVWTEPFEALVGSRRMSAQPLVDYFQPLMDYMKEANGDDVGWEDQCPDLAPQPSSSSRLLPCFGFLGLLLWLLCVLAV